MLQKNILNNCVEQLRQLPPIKNVKLVQSEKHGHEKGFDALLEVETETSIVRFGIEVKGMLKRPIPEHLFLIQDNIDKPFLLMSEYVNTCIANDLKKNHINFIDSQGNTFIHVRGKIYIEIQGKKPRLQRGKQPTALFQPKGLQLLFILLTEKNALNETIRVLHPKAGISFERAVSAMKELKEKRYIQKVGKKQYKFVNKNILLEQWLANYGDRLRPKLVLGTFRIPPSYFEDVHEKLYSTFGQQSESYTIGGSLGADLLTGYYRGYTIEIFIKPELVDHVQKTLKLIPAGDSNVTLLNLFSPQIIYKKKDVPFSLVHPLLIYAELLYQGGGREIDTAKLIFDNYLKQDFDES